MSSPDDHEPDEEAAPEDRPLPAGFAPAWTMAALAASLGLFWLTAVIRPEKGGDVVNLQLCFSLGLGIATYGVCRFHMPTRGTAEALGLRRPPLGIVALAVLVGCAMLLPASWIDDRLEQLFPRPAEEIAQRASAMDYLKVVRRELARKRETNTPS